jgi:GAF domain-containing protein
MDDAERIAVQAIADQLTGIDDRYAFRLAWHARTDELQRRVLRVLAARAARAAPDGVHHRQYRTGDAELDALVCSIVEAVRHRLPERGRVARAVIESLGRRSHNAAWRLTDIIRDAARR